MRKPQKPLQNSTSYTKYGNIFSKNEYCKFESNEVIIKTDRPVNRFSSTRRDRILDFVFKNILSRGWMAI